MKTVNIGDLKANLSAHIRRVIDGEEVLVCDRNRPVARIIPIAEGDWSEQEERLIRRGVLRPPRKKRRLSSRLKPAGHVSNEVMARVWQEEREAR